MQSVSSWGRLNNPQHDVVALTDVSRLPSQLVQKNPGLAHGMGRSYGDVCLNPDGVLWSTVGLDRFIRFDAETGILVCEAGLQLGEIQALVVPRGWMLPVTPGTEHVTVGGAIANDVHGKNHHRQGCFGNHVRKICLQRTDGTAIVCGPQADADWFAATVGGLGLTGVITQAELQLRRVPGPWLETETIAYGSLEEFFQLADESEAGWEYTVSWIDGSHSGGGQRGLFMRANHIDSDQEPPAAKLKLAVPFALPVSPINRLSLNLFNGAYFDRGRRQAGRRRVHYAPFFYPLDNIRHWNRLYGRRGFYQYQSVVPREAGRAAIREMMQDITRAGEGSFLSVLKTFGDRQAAGMLSFPQPGVTLALDFPNHGQRTQDLFGRLDSILRAAGGRIYPAKDARMPRDLFETGYPQLNEFLKYRDPGISSALSRRLMGA